MNKKGFTLVELLAVVVLLAVIATLGFTGVSAVRKNIYNNLWQGTVTAIESGAQQYGEDNKLRIIGKCDIDVANKDGSITTEQYDKCIKIKVETLIKYNYVPTKNIDINGNKVLINEAISDGDAACTDKRYLYDKESDAGKTSEEINTSSRKAVCVVNNMDVYVYMDNNHKIVYAKLAQ